MSQEIACLACRKLWVSSLALHKARHAGGGRDIKSSYSELEASLSQKRKKDEVSLHIKNHTSRDNWRVCGATE